MILSLDLSTKSTGYAIFDLSGKLLQVEHIRPSDKLSVAFKTNQVVNSLKSLYPKVDTLCLEDTFFGKNVRTLKELSRLAGAVINSWIDHCGDEPTLYMPKRARSILGIKVDFSKAELQLWVLKNVFGKNVEEFDRHISEIRKKYAKRRITKHRMSTEIAKLTDEIESRENLSNDQADAIIVGKAHLKQVYNIN